MVEEAVVRRRVTVLGRPFGNIVMFGRPAHRYIGELMVMMMMMMVVVVMTMMIMMTMMMMEGRGGRGLKEWYQVVVSTAHPIARGEKKVDHTV